VKRGAKGINKPLLVTAIAMFVLSTAHIVVQFVQAIRTFILYGDPPAVSLRLYYIQGIFYVTNK
jgi:hypothetical protein